MNRGNLFPKNIRKNTISFCNTKSTSYITNTTQSSHSYILPKDKCLFFCDTKSTSFSKLKSAAEDHHEMYLITKPPTSAEGHPPGAIIPLSAIRQSCHLFPDFSHGVPAGQTTDTVLDKCKRFYLNSFSSKYAYQTIW